MDSSNVYKLEEISNSTDSVYQKSSKAKRSPIIIDNGSFYCRAGYACDNVPHLLFRNQLTKVRNKDGNSSWLVGNEIDQVEAYKYNLRTQFDKNVVVNFDMQETTFDYIFSHLSADGTEPECVPHPIICTETYSNCHNSRLYLNELLFECYNVPSVFIGIDSMFSYFNYNKAPPKNALIISISHNTTHIVPVCNGSSFLEFSKRINVGGYHIINQFQRLLQLKYPYHSALLTPNRALNIGHKFLKIFPDDYFCMMESFCDSLESGKTQPTIIQLPFSSNLLLNGNGSTCNSNKEITAENIKVEHTSEDLASTLLKDRENQIIKEEKKLKLIKQLHEQHNKKRLEKIDQLQKELEELQNEMSDISIDSDLELKKKITFLEKNIEQLREKIVKSEKIISGEEIQISSNKAHDYIKSLTEEQIEDLKKKKEEILLKKSVKKKNKRQSVSRRTAAYRNRMKLISELAEEEVKVKKSTTKKKKVNDTFGMADSDWDVYKEIKKSDSDSESDEEALQEIDAILNKYEKYHPKRNQEIQVNSENTIENITKFYQLDISTDQYRVAECLFYPSIVGIDQAGLLECIKTVFCHFSPTDQQSMAENIYVTGGVSKIPGLSERLNNEIRSIRPFKSKFSISFTDDPLNDSWCGAKKWYQLETKSKDCFVTRTEYQEHGAGYIKPHILSNKYHPVDI